jgi:hypothetical protein
MRTFKAIVAALALPGLMAAAAVEASVTRSLQAKPKIAVNQRPVCAPGMVLRQISLHQGYAPLRCVQSDAPNDGGMSKASAGGSGNAILIVGGMALVGVGLGVAAGGGGDDSPGG